MSAMASQITDVSIIYSTVCSGADQRKHQSFASLAFVRGIHRWPVNSPHKEPVTWKMFLVDSSKFGLCPTFVVVGPYRYRVITETVPWQCYATIFVFHTTKTPDSKVHGANMGPTWVLSAPDGPHVGLMNLEVKSSPPLFDLFCFFREGVGGGEEPAWGGHRPWRRNLAMC